MKKTIKIIALLMCLVLTFGLFAGCGEKKHKKIDGLLEDYDYYIIKNKQTGLVLAADEYGKKSRWDRIYIICPMGNFIDDHTRSMTYSNMEARRHLFDILCENYKRIGLWDKGTILDGGYWENFEKVV